MTFLNPGRETFANFPNQKLHCATQYFEGMFNPKLKPGERFQYTFDRAGEFFFNDCTDPRPTGKVVAYHVPEDVAGALSFEGGTVNLGSPTGIFTDVQGVVTARFRVPAGYMYEGEGMLKTPLSPILVPAVAARLETDGKTLALDFNRADLDNNVPTGTAVPLVPVGTLPAWRRAEALDVHREREDRQVERQDRSLALALLGQTRLSTPA